MIIVTLTLHGAHTGKTRQLGTVRIANDTTGSARAGNYQVAVQRPGGRWRIGRVTGFPRRSRSALELLRRALNDLASRKELP